MSTRLERLFFVVLPAVLLMLYVSVGFFSAGYDDEMYNIRWFEAAGQQLPVLWHYVQSVDVHPPLSYVIDGFLFNVLGDWHWVRAIISLFTAGVLVRTVLYFREKQGAFSGLTTFVFLGLNPALLMWCTGLRWYAFFVPILILLLTPPLKAKSLNLWTRFSVGVLVLGYLNYLVFLVALPLFVFYWLHDNAPVREKLKNIAMTGVPAFLLFIPQLLAFVSVHYPNRAEQLFSLKSCVIGFLTAEISNQGVFPLSIAGVISALGMGLMALSIVHHHKWATFKNNYVAYYLAMVFLFFVSGVAGKFRNFVVLAPAKAFAFAELGVRTRTYLAGFSLVALGAVWGCYNVVSHQDTTKNSWNMPRAEVLSFVESFAQKCSSDVHVVGYEPVLVWQLKNKGFTVTDLLDAEALLPAENKRCVVVLETFIGTLPADRYAQVLPFINRATQAEKFGLDKFYALKKKIAPDYPEALLTAYLIP